MPNWKKVILSGSIASLNSLTVSNGITGSLFGTASYISPTFISASAAAAGFGAGTSISASYAATASLVNGNVNVTQAVIGNTTYITVNETATTGTTTIHSIPTSSYSSTFIEYVISDTTNSRAGNIQSVWLGSNVNFTETATMDIGNTTDFDWDVIISGNGIKINSVVAAGSWDVKINSRQM